ncbi:MAG: polyamine ABC transporter ATP-binding protein [Microthrixaceae bacterium]|nr:polyamine ABC transporter ATP-binding protein [Microthrixaceae bacterium]
MTDEPTLKATTSDVIVLEGVRKEFGSFVAVERADFSIARGEFFSMLGPSGCGKTTLLKMIAGFEQPSSGRVLLEGKDVSTVPPYKRNVNTVFQQYALFPHMSIVDNVAFGLRSKKVPAAEARKRSMEMLEIVKLAEFANRRSTQLSGGQQQRVALARALVNLPAALLLDEPLAALDLKLREAMQIELKRIQREVNITFIFVTHDQGEALTMSDRIAVMSRGRVEQIGTPTEIYDSPASIFVAGFIGSANLLPGRLSINGSTPTAVLDSGVNLEVSNVAGHSDGDPITVMLRPERIDVGREARTADGRSMPATVKDVIFQGSNLRVIADGPANTELLVSLEADDEIAGLRPGDEVTLSWSQSSAFLLKGRSEIVGATTTDVDEVQATMAGKDISDKGDAVADDGPKLDRRKLLIGGGVAVVAAVGAVGLSSIGGDNKKGSASTGGDTSVGGGLGGGADELHILNWTEYIDVTADGEVGTVDRFKKATGIEVEYSETYNDNNEAYGKEFAAYLDAGSNTPWDVVMPTYWMVARLKSKGWLAPLPFNLIPNYKNLDPSYLNLAWDLGAKYHLPWQSGFTGIAYNINYTGRELKSINDLFDPAFKGKVGFLTEMRDAVGLVMLAQGNDPSEATEDTLNEALDKIEQAKDEGHIRRFHGNDYLQDLENGNLAACTAWSGDIAQTANPDVRFVFPEEGAMNWFDSMVIPVGAANGAAAAKWMNFVYDPVNAARITAYVQYVSPVVGVREELEKQGGDTAALAENPLLFPDADVKSRMYVFAELPTKIDQSVTDRFVTITGG